MRLLALIAVLGAGSAFAATGVKTSTAWHLLGEDTGIAVASVRKDHAGTVGLSVVSPTFTRAAISLTKEEAASLGRALLEAAGEKEPEKISMIPDCIRVIPNGSSQMRDTGYYEVSP